ncbi:ATP-dependent nuclease [Heliorestis convoluta]|uniref:Uncharacterized protein n=1 Tax=Heliorestis convoluta TaxID=356322 RepID=A0A5Q2N1D7_9FIRM|nr:AAA family ATPase [Heliorestis convoluta]QGG47629.1 hypothetical protein FTV88_1529 [Heliorestis convoluta]
MSLKYIKINNFRGLDTFSASISDGMLIIVGQNDVGKSSALKAIQIFLEDGRPALDDFPKFNQDAMIEIEIHFNVSGLEELKHENLLKLKQIYRKDSNKVNVQKQLYSKTYKPTEEELDSYKSLKSIGEKLGVEFPTRKPSNADEIEDLKKRVIAEVDSLEPYGWNELQKEDWIQVEKLLPEVLFVPAAQDHDNEQKMTSDSSVFGKLFRVGIRNWLKVDQSSKSAINTIEGQVKSINSKILKIVEDKLKEQTPLIEELKQELEPLDVSKGFTFTMFVKDGQGIDTPLSQRGSGLQRSVLIAILRAQNEINDLITKMSHESQQENNSEDIKPTLYIIEEPEAFLHLAAQKELFYSLKDLSEKSGQVFITTHSTLFMDEADMQDIVLLTRQNGKTISLQHIPEEQIHTTLGELRVSELLTGKVCCIVEGVSDKQVFQNWIKKLGFDPKRLGIHFITMDGCANAEYYANADILIDFQIPFVLILDRDKHEDGRDPDRIKNRIEDKHRWLRGKERIRILDGELENYFVLEAVSNVLRIPIELIDPAEYDNDPKEAMAIARHRAEEAGKVGVRVYNEKRDSKKIAELMTKEDILVRDDIKEVIKMLIELSGEEFIDDSQDDVA